jgi:hypothetical protein
LIARFLPLAAAAAVCLLALSSPRAEASLSGVPASGRQEFTIFRDGEVIGRHVSEFTRSGDRLTVRTHMTIAVKVLLVTAFSFEMDSEEQWVGDQLVAMRTRANDDGRKKALDARRDDGAQPELLRIDYNGHPSTLPVGLLPTSLWNPDTVRQSELVDVLNGKRRQVTITARGAETLQVAGQRVEAQRYLMTGELERELWYGPDGQLLKVELPGDDGSEVTLLRKSL